MGVVAQVDSPNEGSLFAHGRQFLLFGGAGQENGCVVAEHAGQNLVTPFSIGFPATGSKLCYVYHDDRYGKQDPVAESYNKHLFLQRA